MSSAVCCRNRNPHGQVLGFFRVQRLARPRPAGSGFALDQELVQTETELSPVLSNRVHPASPYCFDDSRRSLLSDPEHGQDLIQFDASVAGFMKGDLAEYEWRHRP